MITGICERLTLYLIRRHSSIPSMGSIITSVTTRFTSLRSICNKASSPSVAVTMLYSFSKHRFSYSNICTLSSTSSNVWGLACVPCVVVDSAFIGVTSPIPLPPSLTGTSCTKGKVSTNTFISASSPMHRWPLCNSANERARAKPMPVPDVECSVVSIWKKGSNIFSRKSMGMMFPSLATVRKSCVSSVFNVTEIYDRQYFTALLTRLLTILVKPSWST